MVCGSTWFTPKGAQKKAWALPDGPTCNEIDCILIEHLHFSVWMSVRAYTSVQLPPCNIKHVGRIVYFLHGLNQTV